MKASTETHTFSTQKHHEKKTNFFYSTNCKRLLSLVLTLDCMSLPMMPLSLLPEDAILHSTIVDILNFQPFLFSTLGFTGNCIFKVLAIAKFWQCTLRVDKLNGRTKRKIEYFSFLKHPFRHQIFNTARKTSIKMTDYPNATTVTARTPPSTAAMTASEQQTGVITRVNE